MERGLKVAMICHFSNKDIRSFLPLSSMKLENFVTSKLFSRKRGYGDFAKWNTNIINGLSTQESVNLYVISPHVGLKTKMFRFEDKNVHYSFFRGERRFPFNYLDLKYHISQKNGYKRNRKIVKSEIQRIDPDIVLLVGAENPYYSITALDIENKPVFLQCQTVYANPERKLHDGNFDQHRWDVEMKLFEKIRYYACSPQGRMYYDLIKQYKPEAFVFPRKWPVPPFPEVKQLPKKYDFVYFAHYLNRKKGFDNAIEAVAIVAKKHPEVKVLAIGGMGKEGQEHLDRIAELGLEKNFDIHGPFADYVKLLEHVSQARFALLPIKMDVLSGTIGEAMQLGLPIATFRTSGTPALNNERETVMLADIDDNQTLAENMMALMENPTLVEKLKKNMAAYVNERNTARLNNVNLFVRQMQAVINHYNNGVEIPEELLLNPNEK